VQTGGKGRKHNSGCDGTVHDAMLGVDELIGCFYGCGDFGRRNSLKSRKRAVPAGGGRGGDLLGFLRLALAVAIVLAAQCWRRRRCRPRGGLMFHVFVIRAPRKLGRPVPLADSLNGLVRSLCRLT
jgi:hypothetical protein